MQDECTIDRYSVTYDTLGDEIKVFTPSSGVACGVKFTTTKETYKGEYTSLNIDAIIRLPIDTEISPLDRLTITKRFGVVQSGIQYSINGNPLQGVSCIEVMVNRVEV